MGRGREKHWFCRRAKTYTIVRNMLLRGMEDADIMAVAEGDREFIEKVRIER